MKKIFLIILAAVVVLSVSLLVFINSPSFLKVTVNFINNHTSLHLEIGSLSFDKGPRIIIKDLVIDDKKKDGFRLILPYAEIRAGFKGLISKKIEEIVLVKPGLSFIYKKEKKGAASLPFTFNKLSVTDADVTLHLEKGKSFHVHPITVSLDKLPDGKDAELRGSAFVSELGSTVSLTAEIDTEKFDLVKAHLDVSPVDLANFSAAYPLSFLKDKKLEGAGNLSITMARKDITGISKIKWQSSISIYDLIIQSRAVSANFKSKPIGLSSHGIYDSRQDTLDIESLSVRLSQSDFLALHGTVKQIFSGKPEINIIAESKNIPLHEIKYTVSGSAVKWLDEIDTKSRMNMALAITGELHAPEVKGEISLRGERLAWKYIKLQSFAMKLPFEYKEQQLSGAAYLNLSNAGFSSSDGSIVAEGIEMKVSGNFGFSLPADRVDFSLYSEAANFELLSGRFYGNFRDKVLGFSAKGTYNRANGSLNITESKTSLTNTGNIFISGSISGLATSPFFNADIKLDSLPNREVYNFFIRETFQEQYPIFSQIEVNGESSMRLSVSGTPEYFTVRGEVNIADMNILGNTPGKALKDINMRLPVDLSYPQNSHTGGISEYGFLKIKDLSWASFTLKNIEAFPAIWHNAVLFKEDIKLPVMGGDIVLKNISYSDIFSPERQLRLSVDILDIDLHQAGTAFGLPEFSGNLSGTIPTVNFTENRILTDGEIDLELFGGKMKFRGLSIDNIFSPAASLQTSIELEGIDLGKLTGTFDFGQVSGIIKGNIDNLVIVKGQAESFKASLETYKKRGVEQKISVKALKNISILGTGDSTSILDMGIYQFFKEYRYDKLGFRALLKNDNLLLLGIEKEGDREYLVKGGILPPKVDVISYTQNISFQEMVNRLKRIKQAEK